MGEINQLITLCSNGHSGDDGVIVACNQVGDDRIPFVHNPLTLKTRTFTQVVDDAGNLAGFEIASIVNKIPKVTASPFNQISPALGISKRLVQRSRVDFPEPEEPMMATTCPAAAVKSTPRKTRFSPKDFSIPRRLIRISDLVMGLS